MKQVLLALFLLSATQMKAQSRWIDFSISSTIELDASANKSVELIPLNHDGVDGKSIHLKGAGVRYVRLNNRFSQIYLEAIHAQLTGTDQRALRLETDLNKLRLPGDYQVEFLFVDSSNGARVQPLVLLVRRPAMTLTTPKSRLELNASEEGDYRFVLQESGGSAGRVDLPQPLFDSIPATPFVFREAALSVPANGQQTVYFHLSDSFRNALPLGGSVGSWQLKSPEMSAPVNVSFFILKKRSPIWILLPVLIGFLVGFLVRHYLDHRAKMLAAQAPGYALLRLIREMKGRIADSDTLARLADLESALGEELGKPIGWSVFNDNKPTEVTNLIGTKTTEFNTLISNLRQRAETLLGQLRPFGYYVESSVSSAITLRFLEGTTQRYRAGIALLDTYDLTGAAQALADVKVSMERDVVRYHQTLQEATTSLKEKALYPVINPDSVTSALQPLLAELEKQLQAFPVVSTDDAPVRAADQCQYLAASALDQARDRLKGTYQAELEKLKPENPLRGRFETDWRAWYEAVDHWKLNMDKEPLAAAAKKLESTWREVNHGTTLGNFFFPFFDLRTKPDLAAGLRLATEAGDLPPASPAHIEQTAFVTTVYKTVLIYFLIAIVLYLVYEGSFIGTIPEMLRIFLIAFGIDATADRLMQLTPTAPKLP